MTQRSRFFDSVGGDRVYGSDALAQVIFALIGDGVVGGLGFQLGTFENSPPAMNVKVNTGGAFVQGRFLEVYGAAEVLPIAAAHASLPRIDRVVVRVDLAARTMAVAVKTGTAAASPTPPALTQVAGGTWEISLSLIAVGAGVVSIVNANITDDRTFARGSDLDPILRATTGHRHEGLDGTGRKVRTSDLDGTFSDAQHGARGTANAHPHGNLSGIGPDDHHARQHPLNAGADHTGELSDAQHGARGTANAHPHGNLSGVTPDQHHPRSHALDSASDHAGTLPWGSVRDKPATFAPSAHASQHNVGGSDALAFWAKGGALGGRIHVGTSTPDPAVSNESDVWIKG